MATRRAHVVVPEKLIEEVDALVGKRRRSAFFVEAVEDRLKRERRAAAFEKFAGSIPDGASPEWDTVEGIKAWVRSMREERDPWADVPGQPEE
jgi:hypothetical protein